MKKSTKIAVIVIVVLAVVGIIGAGIGIAVTLGLTRNLMKQGSYTFETDGSSASAPSAGDSTPSPGSSAPAQNTAPVHNLEIDLGSGELEISYADVPEIQVDQQDVSGFQCYNRGGTLHIEGNDGFLGRHSSGKVTVQIPQNTVLGEVELDVGSGTVNVSALSASEVSIDVGSGSARLDNIDTHKLNADVEAGSVYVKLAGAETDYNYEAECERGQIVIGKTTVTGMKTGRNPDASRYMELDCERGQIEVQFQI